MIRVHSGTWIAIPIAVAAFLGTPLAAAWLAARGFRALGQEEAVGRTWGAGILIVGVLSVAFTVLMME